MARSNRRRNSPEADHGAEHDTGVPRVRRRSRSRRPSRAERAQAKAEAKAAKASGRRRPSRAERAQAKAEAKAAGASGRQRAPKASRRGRRSRAQASQEHAAQEPASPWYHQSGPLFEQQFADRPRVRLGVGSAAMTAGREQPAAPEPGLDHNAPLFRSEPVLPPGYDEVGDEADDPAVTPEGFLIDHDDFAARDVPPTEEPSAHGSFDSHDSGQAGVDAVPHDEALPVGGDDPAVVCAPVFEIEAPHGRDDLGAESIDDVPADDDPGGGQADAFGSDPAPEQLEVDPEQADDLEPLSLEVQVAPGRTPAARNPDTADQATTILPIRGYYLTRSDDTLRSVAAQFLNAPGRWQELRSINAAHPGVADAGPDDLLAEQTALALPGDPLPWGTPDPVRLWTLAESFLFAAWGREPSPEEVVPFWRGLTTGALPPASESPALAAEMPAVGASADETPASAEPIPMPPAPDEPAAAEDAPLEAQVEPEAAEQAPEQAPETAADAAVPERGAATEPAASADAVEADAETPEPVADAPAAVPGEDQPVVPAPDADEAPKPAAEVIEPESMAEPAEPEPMAEPAEPEPTVPVVAVDEVPEPAAPVPEPAGPVAEVAAAESAAPVAAEPPGAHVPSEPLPAAPAADVPAPIAEMPPDVAPPPAAAAHEPQIHPAPSPQPPPYEPAPYEDVARGWPAQPSQHDPTMPYAGMPAPAPPAEFEAPSSPHFLPSVVTSAPVGPATDAPQPGALRRSLVGPAIGDAMVLMRLARRRQARQGVGPVDPQFAALQQSADAESLRLIDAAMRHLRAVTVSQHRPPPEVLAVRFGSYGFEVLLSRPCETPPGWRSASGGYVLELPPGVTAHDLAVADWSTPLCPALVPVGNTYEGPLMLNLDEIGFLVVSGPAPVAMNLLAALITALDASPMSDEVRLTAVGFEPLLPHLGWERVNIRRYDDPELERLFTAVERPDMDVVMIAPGNDVLIQRAGQYASAGQPQLAVVGAIAAVGTRQPWSIHLDSTGTAVLHPINVTLTAASALPTELLAELSPRRH